MAMLRAQGSMSVLRAQVLRAGISAHRSRPGAVRRSSRGRARTSSWAALPLRRRPSPLCCCLRIFLFLTCIHGVAVLTELAAPAACPLAPLAPLLFVVVTYLSVPRCNRWRRDLCETQLERLSGLHGLASGALVPFTHDEKRLFGENAVDGHIIMVK